MLTFAALGSIGPATTGSTTTTTGRRPAVYARGALGPTIIGPLAPTTEAQTPYACDVNQCVANTSDQQTKFATVQQLLNEAQQQVRNVLGPSYTGPSIPINGIIDVSAVQSLGMISASGAAPTLTFTDVRLNPQFIADNADTLIATLAAFVGQAQAASAGVTQQQAQTCSAGFAWDGSSCSASLWQAQQQAAAQAAAAAAAQQAAAAAAAAAAAQQQATPIAQGAQCPAGTTWDPGSQLCVSSASTATPSCPAGSAWDPVSQQCLQPQIAPQMPMTPMTWFGFSPLTVIGVLGAAVGIGALLFSRRA